jgi:hypothetical protein
VPDRGQVEWSDAAARHQEERSTLR